MKKKKKEKKTHKYCLYLFRNRNIKITNFTIIRMFSLE